MPALATFGRASRREIAKVIKRARYKSGGNGWEGREERTAILIGLSAFRDGTKERGRKHAITQEPPCRRYPVCLLSLYRRAADSRFLKNAQTCQRAFSRPDTRVRHVRRHFLAVGNANNLVSVSIFSPSSILITGSQTADNKKKKTEKIWENRYAIEYMIYEKRKERNYIYHDGKLILQNFTLYINFKI